MAPFGLYGTEILLPKQNFEQWAVIACDQFTSEPAYWEQAERIAGDAPSALRLVLPEVFLDDRADARVSRINRTMREYLRNGVFAAYPNAMIYVERETSGGLRRGIVGAVDLAQYDYRKGSRTLIRASEETVPDRIGPRVGIRKDAVLELPHALLLADDPGKTVIEPLARRADTLTPAYDFDLMLGGGHIRGYFVPEPEQRRIADALRALAEPADDPMLFAVGDGNHSLAAAKACFEQSPTPLNRYALAEIVNIHDPSLTFEPIYRVLYAVDPADVLKAWTECFGEPYTGSDRQTFTWCAGDDTGVVYAKPVSKLPVGTLQFFIERYLARHPGATVDYIHGESTVRRLAGRAGAIGFLFEGMRKEALFPAVRTDGSLPRKTFSMGEATDKRYYIECRKIR